MKSPFIRRGGKDEKSLHQKRGKNQKPYLKRAEGNILSGDFHDARLSSLAISKIRLTYHPLGDDFIKVRFFLLPLP